MRLQTKLILLICSLILLVININGFSFENMVESSLKQQIGTRSLDVAKTVALIPEIREAFQQPEPWKTIQPIVSKIQASTGAEFVVVGNREGIRYSHPIPGRIGKEMVGGDNRLVFQGQSIISEAVGSLGPSLRGKTPIYDTKGNIIGIVSVGFLIEDIEAAANEYRNKVISWGLLSLSIGIIGALFISRNVKRSILGLEPEEITRLYQEKGAILQSIREGIVAINSKGTITMVNSNALTMMGLSDKTEVIGKDFTEVFTSSNMMRVLETGKAEYDQEAIVGDEVVVANRLPIMDQHQRVIGVVSSFRSKSELYRLAEELAQVKQYAEALRAQTHEYSNKLYMISGLIQLESYQEAIEAITGEVDIHQNLIQFIMQEIPDPMIGGLLIGKFNRANELKVELEIDRESSFQDLPPSIDRNNLVTIIGNLIENAMEAVLNEEIKKVKIFLTDLGEDLIIEVEDTGPGISDENIEKVFQLGFSTKATANRGVGLALVKESVQKCDGYITYSRNSYGGSIFTVAIPKNGKEKGNGKHSER